MQKSLRLMKKNNYSVTKKWLIREIKNAKSYSGDE